MACLNRHFRIVWSECHQHWVVASEVAKGKKKSSAQSIVRAAVLMGAVLSPGAVAAASLADTDALLIENGATQVLANGDKVHGWTIGQGGRQLVSAGAEATGSVVTFGGEQAVHTGGMVSGTLLTGMQTVDGGIASATTINTPGRQIVLNQGQAVNTLLNSGGQQIISSGGVALGAQVTLGGHQSVQSGGLASNTILNSGGLQLVSNGGQAVATLVHSGGSQNIDVGGLALNAVVVTGAAQDVVGGIAIGTMLGGNQVISREGRVSGATLMRGSWQSVFIGGTAVANIIEAGGQQYVGGQLNAGDGVSIDTTVKNGGIQYVGAAGAASNTLVHSGGSLMVSSGGQARTVDQRSGARLFVTTNATVTGTNQLGNFSIDNDSHIARNLLLEDGSLTVFQNGTAIDTTANGRSRFAVEDGGVLAGFTRINDAVDLVNTKRAPAKNISGAIVGTDTEPSRKTLPVNIINRGDLYFNQSASQSFDGVISGEGRFYKQNAGTTLTLAAAQRYTGMTTVEAGVLRTAVADAISQGDLAVLGDGRFELAGNQQTVKSLSGSGVVALDGAQLTLGQNGSVDNRSAIFSGLLDGSGSLVKTGSYTQVLSGRLNYGPVTYIHAGTLILDGSSGGGHLLGDVVGVSGSHLILQNGATLTGSIDPLDVTVDKTSTWTMTGNSLVDTLTIGGHVDMAAPSGTLQPKQLTAINLAGTGGRITLNAALEGNASLSDKVIINGGQASGNTALAIRNAGGLGAQTTGDGILLVDAINGGTTTVDAFSLAGPVLAGAYEYSLHRGGASDAQDWFLTSQNTGTGTGTGTGQPNYRAEVSLDSVTPSLALEYGSTVLGSLNERRAAQGGERVWSRIVAQETRHGGAASGVIAGDARYQSDLYLTQVGGDLYQQQQNGIDDRAGVYGAIGQSAARVDHHDGRGAGKVTLDGYSIGAYWTRSSDNGWYGDSVLQATWNDIKSHSANNLQLESDGMSWLASVEGGYRRQLDNGVLVEPQLQLAYQQLKLADSRDSAANIGFDRSDSLRTRLSVRFARDWELGDARTLSAWLRPGLVHESKGRSQTRFMTADAPTVAVQSPLGGTSLQLLAGVQGQVGKQSSINLKASYETRLSGGTHDKYGVQLGFNTRF